MTARHKDSALLRYPRISVGHTSAAGCKPKCDAKPRLFFGELRGGIHDWRGLLFRFEVQTKLQRIAQHRPIIIFGGRWVIDLPSRSRVHKASPTWIARVRWPELRKGECVPRPNPNILRQYLRHVI